MVEALRSYNSSSDSRSKRSAVNRHESTHVDRKAAIVEWRRRPILRLNLADAHYFFLKNGTKLVDAQKTEISVSADGDFGELKKTETLSKRRVGR